MRKNSARLGMLGTMLAMFGMGGLSNQAPLDGRDVQGQDEGRENVSHFWSGHQPIYIPSWSQRVKSKRLIASNKRQGRK